VKLLYQNYFKIPAYSAVFSNTLPMQVRDKPIHNAAKHF